jgi:hypothetical protein
MTRPVQIVTTTAEQLVALVEQAVELAFQKRSAAAASDAQALSGGQAAKLARCRRADVGAALASGVLPGRFKGRRWSTTVADVRQWINDGRPLTVKK